MILLLNGASSTGKTSLCKALQKQWPQPLVYWSLDDLIMQLPEQYYGNGEYAEPFFQLVEKADHTEAVVGEWGREMNVLSARYVASFARSGFDMVVDYVMLDPETLQPFVDALKDVPVCFIGVQCSEEELARRNAQREDRAANLSLYQQATIHFCQDAYDYMADTTEKSADFLAGEILAYAKATQINLGIS